MFVISENCLRSATNMFVFVFDEQVNHLKQITKIFKLFNLLKSRLWCVLYPRGQFLINDITEHWYTVVVMLVVTDKTRHVFTRYSFINKMD